MEVLRQHKMTEMTDLFFNSVIYIDKMMEYGL